MSNNIRVGLRQMRAFVVVAETLHFKRAAEALFITQPALSRLVRSLEETLGADLLVRTTRQVALTEAGRLFLTECHAVFRHIDQGVQLAQRAAAGDTGSLTVAYNDFAINGVLPTFLEHFKERHPEVRVDLVYMPSQEQPDALRNGSLDIGFMLGGQPDEGVEVLPVARERLVVVLPVRHPLAQAKVIEIEQLRHERFILGSESGWQQFRALVFEEFRQAGWLPEIIQEASTSIGIFGLVAANMGVSLYSECADRLHREGVATVPLADTEARVETVAAWNAAYSTPTTRLFRQLLGEWCEAQDRDRVGK